MYRSASFGFFLLLFVFVCKAQSYEIGIYELKRGNVTLKLTNLGAVVLSVIVPDRHGKLDDVVLGYDLVSSYKNDTTYFGSIVGRVANRIGGAQFTYNGVHYKLSPNEGNNTLHGGLKGFSKIIWSVYRYRKFSHITFTYDSFDGEEGFPGNLKISVTYLLVGNNKLAIKMKARPLNKPTPVNLAQHSYWNLAGQASGDILSHTIQIFGSKITPVNDQLLPTGEILPIKGTPYDFLEPREIGRRIKELPKGYDINYALDESSLDHFRRVATVYDKKTGRKMELWSNQPGLQFYTGGLLEHEKGKGGFTYTKNAGLCLETQGFPDSVNHPNFPSQIVRPGQTYTHVMLYRFTAY